MKGQQIFHSFLPGVTVAVLTTQPVWAETVNVNGLQLNPTPNVLTSTYGVKLLSNNKDKQLFQISDRSITDKAIPIGTTIARVEPSIRQNLGTQVIGKTGIPVGKISGTGNNQVFKFTPSSSITKHLLVNDFAPSEELLKSSLPEREITQNNVIAKEKTILLARDAKQSVSRQPSASERLKSALGRARTNSGAVKPVELDSCQQQTEGKTNTPVALVLASHKCTTQRIPKQKLVQTEQPQPTVVEQPGTTTPTQVPNYLNPKPNPLQFPTKPEEVKVQGNQPITLGQALELAKRNNRDLQLALLELQRTHGVLREAKAALYPTISVQTQVNRQQSASSQLSDELQQRAGAPDPDQDTVTSNFTATAQLSYDIYTSGNRSSTIKRRKEEVRNAELDVERISEELRLAVSTEYYNLQRRDEQVRIAQSAVKNAQASLKDAEALEQAGVGTRFDVLRFQVNLANAQQTLTNALSRQKNAQSALVDRLSLPQSVVVSAADKVKLAGLWDKTLEESIVLAFGNRPELQQNLIQRNIGEQQRRQALSAIRPQISLVADYDLLDQFDDRVGLTDGYSVALRASMTLFDGGRAKAQAFQAKTNIAIAETQFAQQRNRIRSDVEQAYSSLKANLDNIQTANAALGQAKESLRLARLRFQAGVGTQTEVIAAEDDLTEAEGNRITAIIDYNLALAELQRAVTFRSLR
ncbi:TolC family protein [Calothrix rhizosoleniae]|uniref:TolC family protein n=1 Tax=Calothrix rhizosoleniae TaxID=888997 RepID=UPI000B49B2D1|nr:TolC family protein [Calothrix rhizosoleniae]